MSFYILFMKGDRNLIKNSISLIIYFLYMLFLFLNWQNFVDNAGDVENIADLIIVPFWEKLYLKGEIYRNWMHQK